MAARRLPGLNDLRAFDAAARHCNFHAAAAELHITHSAVGARIRQLEERLGLPLFARDRQMALTAAGAELHAAVQTAIATIDQCLDRIQAAGLERQNAFRLGVPPGFAQAFLVPHLAALQAALGGAELQLQITQGPLEDGLAVCAERPSGAQWTAQFLMADQVVALARPDIAHACQRDLLRTVSAFPLYQATLGLPARHGWRPHLARLGLPLGAASVSELGEPAAVLAAAEAGGLGLASLELAAPALAQGRLCLVESLAIDETEEYFLVGTPARLRQPQARAVHAWAQALWGEGAPRLAAARVA